MSNVLAVTGGIGSGKSEVCKILAECGITAQYNADARAKALYVEVPGLLENIEKSLGCQVRDEKGAFVPALLGARIFNDNAALEKVEELLFPAMIEDFERFAEDKGEQILLFESATFLEKTQFNGFADKVLLVDAPFETRLERACARDNASRDAVMSRMRNQQLMNRLSAGVKDERIDYIIVNDSTREELKEKVMKLLTQIR